MSIAARAISTAPLVRAGALFALSAVVAGCGGDSSTTSPDAGALVNTTAVVATVDAGFTTGEVELVEFGDLSASGGYHSTQSDIDIATHSDDYYLIERFQADRIHKVDLDNPAIFQWQYSSLEQGETGSANPYDLVFVNDQKAYLLRYNKETAWIVDPTADRQADFKIGELDLSGYTPSDAAFPRMSAGVIADGKLYITLQRLDKNFSPNKTSCVAVFDVSTNSEIDTGQDPDCGPGIALNGRNPGDIVHDSDIGLVVQNTGDYAPDYSISGIDVIDPASYSVDTRVQATQSTGLITDIALVDQNKGYFLGYDSFGSLDLRSFDPSSGNVNTGAVAGLKGTDMRDLNLGPNGRLWVAHAQGSSPGLRLLDPGNDQELDFVGTDLLPKSIAFTNIQ